MTEPLNHADRLAAIERRFAADRCRDDSDARLDEIRAQLLADLRVRPTAALWGFALSTIVMVLVTGVSTLLVLR